MFSKLPVALASASLLSVQARTVKSKHQKANQWPQEIDNEWTSHPNFPDGPYGHVYEGQIARAQQWPQAIDDEWTSHPNFPDGPYGHAHEGFAQTEKAGKWPQAIDDEWTSHPNFPDGPYGHVYEAQLESSHGHIAAAQFQPMTGVEMNDYEMELATQRPKKSGKKWPNPEYDDSHTPHPNFPTGPYGPAHDLNDPTAPGPSYPYPPGGYPSERVSSAGNYHQKTKAPAHHKHRHHHHQQADLPPLSDKGSFAQKPSDPNCTSLGCLTDTNDPFTKKTDLPYPVDYPVPDNGMDHDIVASMKHMNDAEGKLGKWELPEELEAAKVPATRKFGLAQKPSVPACTSLGCSTDTMDPFTKTSAPGYPVDYAVPNHGPDTDIAASLKHMNDAEGKLGKWTIPESTVIQLNSDPIVDTSGDSYLPHLSADHAPIPYPVDYPVPDFGLDEDIVSTQAHEAAASDKLGHVWAPYIDEETETWERIPTADAEFKLVQTGVDSDPHLQTYDDRGYLDLHFPKEGMKDVENLASYNFAPTLDHEILTSQQNLADQEALKVHTLSDTFSA